MRPFSIIVAFDSHYGIGKDGRLPWHIPSDLKHFKEITTNTADPAKKNAVIMGRKTWESLPSQFRPLPGRVNVVLSRKGTSNLPSPVLSSGSLEEALKQLSVRDIENVFVIGGAEIYAQAVEQPSCQKFHVTHVQGDHGCDVFFPPISQKFLLIGASEWYKEGEISFQFSDYLRS